MATNLEVINMKDAPNPFIVLDDDKLRLLRQLIPIEFNAKTNSEALLSMLDCVLPIVFESDHPDFPFYAGGTGFVTRYKSRHVVFTAQHCAKPNELASGKAVVLMRDSTKMPLRQEVHIDRHSNGNANDNAWTDVSCYTVYDEELQFDSALLECIDLDELASRRLECRTGQPLLIAGYRSSCEPPKIEQQMGIEFGYYMGPSESRHCHLFQRMMTDHGNPNGFSGSPVFSFRFNGRELQGLNLMGIVVQSSDNHPEIRFVGIEVLIRFVNRVVSFK